MPLPIRFERRWRDWNLNVQREREWLRSMFLAFRRILLRRFRGRAALERKWLLRDPRLRPGPRYFRAILRHCALIYATDSAYLEFYLVAVLRRLFNRQRRVL